MPVERDQNKFSELIENLIGVIYGDFPEPGPDCQTCTYLEERLSIGDF